MRRSMRVGRLAAVAASVGASVALQAGTAQAATTTGAVTRTFSFIAGPRSATRTVANIDSLLINARCDSSGLPVVFAFTSASRADIFGRIFDGNGRVHIFKNTSFTSKTKGIQLSPSSGDFDATGSVMFENSAGKVVTLSIAFDNSTTLVQHNVCTVFGSVVAT
ncbi:MAG TPA: hypothetical protein VGH67_16625 [Solirubrobacteraceae bacterium]